MKLIRYGALGLAAALALSLAACGEAVPAGADAAGADAAGADAAISTPSPAERPAEVVTAAGRVTGGGITVDVQIGHAFAQSPATGGGTTVEGAAAIK